MHKKLTITIDQVIYDMLKRVIGQGKISQYLESLARKDLSNSEMIEGYKAMAADQQREKEANEWCEGLLHGNTTW